MKSDALITNRTAYAQILVCLGCCCGNVAKGNPSVPVEWLKAVWKQQKLHRTVHLTITGCLGPCDLLNVICIVTPQGDHWFGNITTDEPYRELHEWALRCRQQRMLLPLPALFEQFRFDRFPEVLRKTPEPTIMESR